MKQSKKVKDFLSEVATLCHKYRLSVEHEDTGGSFVIVDRSSKYDSNEWFQAARDETHSGAEDTIAGLEAKVQSLEATIDHLNSRLLAGGDSGIPF